MESPEKKESFGPGAQNNVEGSQRNEKRRVLVVESDLLGLGLSSKELAIVLEKLNELHREGKIQTVEAARELAPNISELKSDTREEKQKPPRHTKRKGEKY